MRLPILKRHRALSFILIGYVLLGFYYGLSTPIFEKPDEAQHFFFVREIVEQGRLPLQREGVLDRWQQEGSQPPLYYLLGAALTFWTDASDWREFAVRNPYTVQGDPLALGNKNVFLHNATAEAFPWRGTVLAVQLLRMVSLLCGLLSVVVTYQLARQVSLDPVIALGAAAFQAYLPQFLFMSSAVSNDALATLLCGLVVWQSVCVTQRQSSSAQWALLGLLVGLAALTKLSGALMAMVAVWAVVGGSKFKVVAHAQLPITHLRSLFMIAFVAALVAGWWYVRNGLLYGDVTGLNRMLAIVGVRQPAPSLWQLLDETEGLRLSFWGVFGWFDILMPRAAYWFYDGLGLIAALGLGIGGLMGLRRTWGAKERTPLTQSLPAAWRHPLTLLGLTCALVLGGVLRWGMLTPGLQGRLLFPALSPLAVLIGIGLAEFFQVLQRVLLRTSRFTSPILPVAFYGLLAFCMAALIPAQVIAPAYAYPAFVASSDQPVLLRFGERETIELLNVEVPTATARPGELIPVTLHWRASQPLTRRYTLYLKLFGENDELLASADTYPGFGMFPTTDWPLQQIIIDHYQLRIGYGALLPVLAKLNVGFYEKDGPTLLPFQRDGQRVVRPIVARVKIAPSQIAFHAPQHLLDANFADQFTLRGYDLNAQGLTLYWQMRQPTPDDYTVFVHVLDRDGKLLAQRDVHPRNGAYPTSAWEVNEWVQDNHPMNWPPQTARIAVGLYRAPTGARLPLIGGGDAVSIRVNE